MRQAGPVSTAGRGSRVRRYNLAYSFACLVALFTGFASGIAVIPDSLFREDRFWNRTLVTYFFNEGAVRLGQLGDGWSAPGARGALSTASRSTLSIDLDREMRKDVELEFTLAPSVPLDRETRTVRVSVNAKPVGMWKLGDLGRRKVQSVRVERALWNATHPKQIALDIGDPPSGAGGNVPHMGILLSSLVVREVP